MSEARDPLEAYLLRLGIVEVGVHLDGVPDRPFVFLACEQAFKHVVPLAAQPKVIVTADGVVENGVIRFLKEEVDAIVPEAQNVIVIRNLGDGALAPTMDAYIDVEMLPGRDIWLDDL